MIDIVKTIAIYLPLALGLLFMLALVLEPIVNWRELFYPSEPEPHQNLDSAEDKK